MYVDVWVNPAHQVCMSSTKLQVSSNYVQQAEAEMHGMLHTLSRCMPWLLLCGQEHECWMALSDSCHVHYCRSAHSCGWLAVACTHGQVLSGAASLGNA
jgi:hypothetical protein